MTVAASTPDVVACGPERADDVHRLTQSAFDPHRSLDPPSGAGRETVGLVRDELRSGGGAIAELDGVPVGCLRWRLEPNGDLRVGRVAVEPGVQRRGIGRSLMAWAEREARRRGCGGVRVEARSALPDNLAFYRALGYQVVEEGSHDGYDVITWIAMRRDTQAER